MNDLATRMPIRPQPRVPFEGEYGRELAIAIAAVLAAGDETLDIYRNAEFGRYSKIDGSPVTDADLAADNIIRAIIQQAFPADPLLTEEGKDDSARLSSSRCWIVDPIDGTEQFIRGTGEFDVLVAFVEAGRPVAVAGYQPTTATLVIAEKSQGTWVSSDDKPFSRVSFAGGTGSIRVSSSKWFGAPENEHLVRLIASRLDLSEILIASEIGFTPRMFLDPRSLDAMIGIRVGDNQDMASEWDFAVTDLVVHEAGGAVSDLAGNQFVYNKPAPANTGGLLASVSPAVHEQLLAAIDAVRSDS